MNQIVVYDFACQLASYCRAREPAFFANTLFDLDLFHPDFADDER